MGSSTIRINDKTLRLIKEIVGRTGKSKQEVLDKAIEDYRRKQFIMEANEAYAALKSNPEKWREEIKERKEWDEISEGLRDEE